jgi:ABC-2 type transport system permease protein
MTGSVIGHLILKDWRLQRLQILFSIAGGIIALLIIQRGGEGPVVVGTVFFFVALILAGTMLPMAGILNERKKQNLAFLMSLPVSSLQYTISKLVSTVGMFLVPWLTLVAGAFILIETRGVLPRGVIPMTLILALMPFVGLCIITAATMIGETEGWGIAANVVCNSSYGLVYYFLSRVPALNANWSASVPVWNSATLKVLSVEAGLIVLILGLTFFLQSRKRDFIH